jgi:hypothetical protein
MTAERDPLLDRAIDELRALPPVDRAAVERVVAAAAAARVTPADDDVLPARGARRGARWWVTGVVAAAAVIVGFMLHDTVRHRGASGPVVAVAAPAMRPVSATPEVAALDAVPIAQQFVFNSRTAHRVSVVGDFNGWDPQRAPMTRSPDGDLWSATIPILPGRHTFGYMVDDSLFELDPRMPSARDPDLGTQGSVIIVGRP